MSPGVFADAVLFAEKTIRFAGNIKPTFLRAEKSSPLQAIRRMLEYSR